MILALGCTTVGIRSTTIEITKEVNIAWSVDSNDAWDNGKNDEKVVLNNKVFQKTMFNLTNIVDLKIKLTWETELLLLDK